MKNFLKSKGKAITKVYETLQEKIKEREKEEKPYGAGTAKDIPLPTLKDEVH